MKATPELLILRQIQALCQGHAQALQEALQDMALRALTLDQFSQLSKTDRRLLDQFAYRYTRLQDDMGARLMPAILKALGEEVASLSAIDRFARLEQLGWLASADNWTALRHIRNQFAHDYPEGAAERFERLQAATAAAGQLLQVLHQFEERLTKV